MQDLQKTDFHRAAALFYNHGGRAVFFGRFVAFARTLMPRLVAMGGVPYRRFLAWDALGITTQVVASVAVGYAAGGAYQLAAEIFGRATGAFLLLLLVLAGLIWFGRYLGKHPDPVTAFRDRLVDFSAALHAGDAAELGRLLAEAKKIRDALDGS